MFRIQWLAAAGPAVIAFTLSPKRMKAGCAHFATRKVIERVAGAVAAIRWAS
jgi:hypothetical protein